MRFPGSMYGAASSGATLWYIRITAPVMSSILDSALALWRVARTAEVWLSLPRHARRFDGDRRFPAARQDGRAREERACAVRGGAAVPARRVRQLLRSGAA